MYVGGWRWDLGRPVCIVRYRWNEDGGMCVLGGMGVAEAGVLCCDDGGFGFVS
jgi:hypothetical protein